MSRRVSLPVIIVLALLVSGRADAAVIGFLNYDLFAGPEFTIVNTSDQAIDSSGAFVDLTGTLSDLTLTLYNGGTILDDGTFAFDSIVRSLTFSTLDENNVLAALPAPPGVTSLVCTDSPQCGVAYDALPAFDSAVLSATFSQGGTVRVAPLLGLSLTADDLFSYQPTVAIDFVPGEPTEVPEPGTLFLVGSGLGAALITRRRSRRR